ncbi:helix-turn-helix transcriptional regulator [Desulfovibrio sp. ZJ200]|uniref:helix-turn-helix transcriptional regulator n=1 Tax=Desulfovibrio sp. ZJ200 TaxID=2709792 RepID=UPI0013ED3A1B|nr:helix-turn-helix transcriptional regulator [Desulfovibrio sp. ZJ200]
MSKRVLDVLPELMQNAEFKAAYEALDQEFSIARALIEARSAAGMTQAEVARKLGVSQPVIARIESGRNVSVKSLRRYARAVGRPISITIQPDQPVAGA